jgi:radical SAM superfamily enzyme YgiQ (UPF0313 family)
MYFKFFILYGFPEDTPEDHRLTEELIAQTKPDAVCCSILQPIPGTEVYEQLKPLLLKDVAEIDFHYWHSTETFKHPTMTHEQLHQDRERLLKVHAKATKHVLPRLQRKAVRLWSMITHPGLVRDLFEIKMRKRRYLKRVAQSDWSWTNTEKRDVVALQVPTVKVD